MPLQRSPRRVEKSRAKLSVYGQSPVTHPIIRGEAAQSRRQAEEQLLNTFGDGVRLP